MAHYLVVLDDTDNWGDRRYKDRGDGDARFEEEMPRNPLVRLLRWHENNLFEERRAVNHIEVTASGHLGYFPRNET